MAPRRLILAMIFLLAVSTIIAIVAPNPSDRQGSERSEPETAVEQARDPSPSEGPTDRPGPSSGPEGSPPTFREATVEVGGPVEEVRVKRGQRVIIEIRSARTVEVSIPALGRFSTSDRWAPAVFDLLAPDRREALEVTEVPTGKRVARILVG